MKSTISLDQYLRQSLINFHKIDNEVLKKTHYLREPEEKSENKGEENESIENPLMSSSFNNCEIIKRKIIQLKKKNNNSLDLSVTSKSYQYRLESARQKIKEHENIKNCTFHPVIDKISKKLAEYLEPSAERITKSKKKKINGMNNSFVSTYKFSPYSEINGNSICINESQNFSLYEKSKRSREKKKIMKEREEKMKLEKENDEISKMFKPHLYKKGKGDLTPFRPKQNFNIYLFKNEKNNRHVEKRKIQRELLSQYNDTKLCTFKPKINSSEVLNDDNLIQYQVPYINDYVNEKRKKLNLSIEKQNRINSTITSSQRRYIINNNNNSQKQTSQKNKNSYKKTQTPVKINEQRKLMGTTLFYV